MKKFLDTITYALVGTGLVCAVATMEIEAQPDAGGMAAHTLDTLTIKP